MEVCEMTPHPGLPGPRQMQNSIMYGKVLDEQEKRETLHRLALKRQQSNNFYLSESAKNVSNNKSSISAAERKAIRNRLATRPAHTPPRPKSPMGLGHQSLTSPHSAISPHKGHSAAAAEISSPATGGVSPKRASRLEGVTPEEYTLPRVAPCFRLQTSDPRPALAASRGIRQVHAHARAAEDGPVR